MDFKPLPSEVIENKCEGFRKRILRVRAKLSSAAGNHDEKILRRTCLKMGEYLTSSSSSTKDEIDDLITDLHRSTLSLQKRKSRLRNHRRKN
ncbi:MAG: hypothetical protein ABIH78_04450 [Candidatus Peregrinibacteria bacterium]